MRYLCGTPESICWSVPMMAKATRAHDARPKASAAGAQSNTLRELTHDNLAGWAERTFKLPVAPSGMTLSRVVNSSERAFATQPNRKTKQHVLSVELEDRLLSWVRDCERQNLPVVTGATIKAQVDKIRQELISSSSGDAAKLAELAYSNGWLYKFQTRHGLTSKRVHGEASLVDHAAATKGREAMQEISRSYERRDVYNLDETAFLFCTTPAKSTMKERMAGRKQQKKRLTAAVCCNVNMTTKLPILCVGKVRKPRRFVYRFADQLGINYNAKAR